MRREHIPENMPIPPQESEAMHRLSHNRARAELRTSLLRWSAERSAPLRSGPCGAENDAQPSEEACGRAQKTLSWSEGGDEDSEIREMGDDQQLRVTSAAISSGDAEAEHEMGQPRSLNAAGIEEEIAGEEAQDLDQADMFTGGTDSEILQDEEEVAAIHCETTEEEEEAAGGGEDEL